MVRSAWKWAGPPRDLDRDGDVALDLLRDWPGFCVMMSTMRRHRVGIGLDVQRPVGERPPTIRTAAQDDHQDALLFCGRRRGMHERRGSGGLEADVSRGVAARSMKRSAARRQRSRRHGDPSRHFDQAVGSGADLDRTGDGTDFLSGRATQTRALRALVDHGLLQAPTASRRLSPETMGRTRTSRAAAGRRVVDLGAHRQAARVGIERRRHVASSLALNTRPG